MRTMAAAAGLGHLPLRSDRRPPAAFSWIAAGTVELALYAAYSAHHASFHWFTHFFVGAAAALLAMTVVVVARRRAVTHSAVWVVAGHLLAMAPDLLFAGGEAHRRWMDVFLGHVASHYVPGREVTWYAVFLGCLATYLAVVDALRPVSGGERSPRGKGR